MQFIGSLVLDKGHKSIRIFTVLTVKLLVLGPITLPFNFRWISFDLRAVLQLANPLPISVQDEEHERWTEQPRMQHEDGPDVVADGCR